MMRGPQRLMIDVSGAEMEKVATVMPGLQGRKAFAKELQVWIEGQTVTHKAKNVPLKTLVRVQRETEPVTRKVPCRHFSPTFPQIICQETLQR